MSRLSKWVVDIHRDIEGDCEIIKKYEEPKVDVLDKIYAYQQKTKLLIEELRKFREGITDEKVLIGFNMAIAICNKYLGEVEE